MTSKHRDPVLSICALLVAASCGSPAIIPPAKPKGGTPPPIAATDVATADSDAGALPSKVSKVTVYSDRARITRQAKVDVPAEATVFAFRSLPGWVDDGSVQVSVTAGRILDVRVDRRFLAKATDASWQRIEAENAVISNKLAALTDEVGVLDAQKQQIEAIKAFSIAKITQDTVIGNVSVKNYDDVLGFIGNSLRATAKARRDVKLQLDELKPQQEASQRRLE
ncbi:MAG: DUF4140 domain-containing protein, partial [Polyangiales bacterium]